MLLPLCRLYSNKISTDIIFQAKGSRKQQLANFGKMLSEYSGKAFNLKIGSMRLELLKPFLPARVRSEKITKSYSGVVMSIPQKERNTCACYR